MVTIEPGQKGQIPHPTYATLIGGSVYIKLPPEFLPHLNLDQLKEEDQPDRIPIYLQEELGEYGNYGSFWNPDQQSDSQ